jgi:two-component sensor histidine kinase
VIRLIGWLTTDMRAAAQARRFVSLPCADLSPTAQGEVLLLTSELVSNAVAHGSGSPRLDVRVDGEHVTVGVTDCGGGTPAPSPRFDWPNGRNGLRLVQALADKWGVEYTPGQPGKRVWFDLTFAQEATPEQTRRPALRAAEA